MFIKVWVDFLCRLLKQYSMQIADPGLQPLILQTASPILFLTFTHNIFSPLSHVRPVDGSLAFLLLLFNPANMLLLLLLLGLNLTIQQELEVDKGGSSSVHSCTVLVPSG